MDLDHLKKRLSHFCMGYRAKESLSQQQLADLTGISKSLVSNIEREASDGLSIKEINAFSEILGVKLWQFFSYLEEGSGELEDWEVTMSNPGLKYDWLENDPRYFYWLADALAPYFKMRDEVRRKFVNKIKKQPYLIEYIATTDKIDQRLIKSWLLATKEINP